MIRLRVINLLNMQHKSTYFFPTSKVIVTCNIKILFLLHSMSNLNVLFHNRCSVKVHIYTAQWSSFITEMVILDFI